MKPVLIGFLFAAGGYIIAALLAYFLILKLSGNTHDLPVEAAMTSFFIFGPIGFFVTFLPAYYYLRKNR